MDLIFRANLNVKLFEVVAATMPLCELAAVIWIVCFSIPVNPIRNSNGYGRDLFGVFAQILRFKSVA